MSRFKLVQFALCMLFALLVHRQTTIAMPIQMPDAYKVFRVELQHIADNAGSLDEQKAFISDYLSRQGYLQATVEPDASGLRVEPGSRFRLDSLVLRQDVTSTQQFSTFFSSRLLDSLAYHVTDSLRNLGYLYASFTVQNMRLHDSSVTIEADIIKGPSVRLVDTRLEGLKRTNPELVKRYLSLDSDSTISESAIASVEQDASQIPFVTFIPPAQIQPRAGYEQADLALSFAEKRGVLLSGGVGYGGNTPDELLWSLGATVDNLFGDGKEASFKSERREQKRQLLDITYRQPLFLLHADDLQVHVATRDFPESFSEFLFGGQYSTKFRTGLTGSFALTYRSVRPVTLSSYQTFGVDLGTVWSHLNNRLFPTHGYRLTNSITGVWRQYQQLESGSQSFADLHVKSTVESYFAIKPVVLATTIRYASLETLEKLPPISELLLIGGQGSLRGWNQDQFPALRFVTFAFESRLQFTGGYLFLFYDGGLLYNRETANNAIFAQSRYHDGFGGGVYLLSGQKGLSLNLSWNRYTSLNNPLLGVSLFTDL